MASLLSRLRRAMVLAGDRLGARLQRNFYLYVASAFTLIAQTQNTWFPLVRLDPAHDGQSALQVAQVPGVRRLGGEANAGTTIALVLPYFAAVQASGRLGFNNIWPDEDGIVRAYTLRRNESGFELSSLPLALVRAERPQIEGPDAMLINWRGEPFTYPYVSFADVFADLQRERPARPADEFAGKIVIIGSTAPSLFDIKATAVSRQFPGVEILATAIDNLRRGDWLQVPDLSPGGLVKGGNAQ